MLAIEKNIPLSERSGGRYPIYPFRQMEVGDSFIVMGEGEKVRNSVLASCPKGLLKLTSRKVDGGFRFWRVA